MRNTWGRAWRGRAETRLAALLFVVLLAVNLWLNPGRFAPVHLGALIGLAAPLLLATLAVTPPFLAGRGSIDVSVGPLIGLINVCLVKGLILDAGLSDPLTLIGTALGLGLLAGALNGVLAAVLRIQPIVATLGTYLVFAGLTLAILPSPEGRVPDWLREISGAWSILPLAAASLLWLGVKRLPFYDLLVATGSDDRAAFTAGVDVAAVRFTAYCLAGLFAGFAALSLTALIGSGDPNIGPNYTLLAIAAAALGGVSLGGGAGGLTAAFIGAGDIFLLQTVLTTFNVSTFVLQLAYGAVLVLSVCLNAGSVAAAFARRRTA